MSARVSRRSVLRAVGAAPGFGVVGAQDASAQDSASFIVGTRSRAAERAARSRAGAVHRELQFGPFGRAIAGRFNERALEALRRSPGVRYVEPDGTVAPLDQRLPWNVERVQAPSAHADGQTGDGADIAIIDSGIAAAHPDLEANLGEGYAVEPCSGCREPWGDDDGHGTHVAGIAAAVDNDEGVLGVGAGATLHAVRVFTGSQYATVSGLAAGVQWVAEQGYDVANMSLGTANPSSTLRDACRYAADEGVFLVAAAGNDGPCDDCVHYPAANPSVVAVSATRNTDSLASFSSAGPAVELAAPGAYIYSTAPSGYSGRSGTSMAAPHVAGAAGVLMAKGYTSSEARARLQETAVDVGLTPDEQGYGLLDVAAAVDDDGAESPLVVTTGALTAVDETSATVTGSLDALGGADEVVVSFEWGPSGAGLVDATPGRTLSSTGEFAESICGLSAGTTYVFRAVAETPGGDTVTGAEQTFTTDTRSC